MTAALLTPTALSVPKANGSGKISSGWLDTSTLFTGMLDTVFSVVDAADTTKAFKVDVNAGATASTTLTLDTGAQTASRSLLVPVLGGNDTIATLTIANAFTAAQTITATNGLTTLAAATQDAVRVAGRAGGVGSFIGTITPTTLTGNRTWTFPDSSLIVSGSTAALTSGRVPFVTAGGLLIDSANLTFSGSVLSITGALSATAGIRTGASSQSLAMGAGFFIKQASGDNYNSALVMQRNGTVDSWAWVVGADNNLYFAYATNASGADATGDFTQTVRFGSDGGLLLSGTVDVTLSTTASFVTNGGAIITKNLAALAGISYNVDITVSAASTTVMTQTSRYHQILTGTTTHTHTLPAATLRLSFFFINKSTASWTVQRGGSDTIYNTASANTIVIATTQKALLMSDGTSEYSALRV